ncbi:MAG: DedA family protein [Chlamydiales bacterium]|nr:DedA family protein [Chlamydiales bacterium]
MEFLTQHEVLSEWLLHYGSFALFLLLALGIVALPVPDETLMVLAGVLMSQGSIAIPSTVLAAFAGSITGITISYCIGKTVGNYILSRYGGWVGITPEKIQKTHDWFDHLGRWALFFGYFIPGVRHLTGITAGSLVLEYSHFALFAYSGAILWSSTFLSLGYFFGSYWIDALEWAEIYVDEIVIVGVLAAGGFLLYQAFKSNK